MMGVPIVRRIVIALALLLFTGCAHVPKDAGFEDVKGMVGERTAYDLHWVRGTPEDEAAVRAVEGLLKEELTVDSAVQIALLNKLAVTEAARPE